MLGTYIAYSFATKIGGALGFWGGIVATAIVVGAHRRADRDRAAAAHLPRARTVPAARHLRAGAGHQRRHALALGPGRSARPARARACAAPIEVLGRHLPSYDLFLIVIGPAGADRAAFRADAHALRPAGARRDAGPRDGRRARRQSGAAVHRRVRARRRARRPRRRAAGGARAGQSRHRPHRDQRRLRGGRGRRHGLDHRRLSRRRHHRRGQGASASASAWSISASSASISPS